MKKFPFYLLLVSLFLGSCSESNKADVKSDLPDSADSAKPITLTTRQGEKLAGDNMFAFKMFKEVSALNGANTFFSPLSLNMALGMLYNGASGDTRTEMAEVLGMAGFTETEINEFYLTMSQALLGRVCKTYFSF